MFNVCDVEFSEIYAKCRIEKFAYLISVIFFVVKRKKNTKLFHKKLNLI